ncbi:MAG: nitrate reductase [Desulfobacterium sp.]|nr:nitrate reductase [Desulfobacterium sp.]
MYDIYAIITGPLAWLSFAVFLGGSLYRFISLYQLARKKDGAVFQYMNLAYALRSIAHWLTPFGARNMRLNPVMTVVTFSFHIALFIAPLFVFAHVVLLEESFGIHWITLSDRVADILSMVVVFSCIFFFARRIMRPEVKYLTTWVDIVILIIVAAPFATGVWVFHQWAGFPTMTLVHILSGELMLAIIPFTKLFHMFLFPFTRGYIGSEFGGVRMAKDW